MLTVTYDPDSRAEVEILSAFKDWVLDIFIQETDHLAVQRRYLLADVLPMKNAVLLLPVKPGESDPEPGVEPLLVDIEDITKVHVL